MGSALLELDFTPKEWCSIDDLKILKKAGRINIEEMRLIQLMYPDYKINNTNIGRKVLANTEICNEVAEEQHGSRKYDLAELLLLNKVLVSDIFRLTRFSGCYTMNDAKRGYDRIDHNVVILAWWFWGYHGWLLKTCSLSSNKLVIILKLAMVSQDQYTEMKMSIIQLRELVRATVWVPRSGA